MRPDEICYMIVDEDDDLTAMPDGLCVFRADERERAEGEAEIISRYHGIRVRVVKVKVEVLDGQ